MYRIRFHGRGGQGIKTASRVLGSAFFLEGLTVQDSPRYGAERRGAPIVAYVRAAHGPIDERGVIRHPDLVVVVDETLIQVAAADVLTGVTPRTVLLLTSYDGGEVWRNRLRFAGKVLTLPPEPSAAESGIQVASMASAGAAARLLSGISRGALERAVREETAEFGHVETSVESALDAYDRMEPYECCVAEGDELLGDHWERPAWIELPAEGASVSSPAIHAAATSELAKTGLWRTMRPVIEEGRCHRCWWVCSTLCPENAIPVAADGRPTIDYDHCKGCLVCVAVCPHHAIEAVPEPR
ncbi:MAG TPA: 2-oxoacid:acceptor oxidoreductase family protein [Candidatus Binatia bacterium]|nr:2-oxoacid:acceptor oxidoreductase family protein [Candidatus Binatia bacterium]